MKEILLAGSVSTVLAFLLTPAFIRILAKRGYGQLLPLKLSHRSMALTWSARMRIQIVIMTFRY